MKRKKSNSKDDFYAYYYGMRSQSSDEKSKPDKFRVGANARDNQLLIWANDSEREEINKLLVKLGEVPPSGGFASKVRVLDADRSPETLEYLKRLQQSWSQISDTPLILPDKSQVEKSTVATEKEDKDAKESDDSQKKQASESDAKADT